MKVDYIIVGQGLCGTFLSWYLDQYNKTYIIIDEDKPLTASKVSSGIINPITGRRFVKTWMIDELLPFIDKAYTAIEQSLNIKCIEQKKLIHFFSNKETQNIFYDRLQEEPQYLQEPFNKLSITNQLADYFNNTLGYGEIHPCYLVHTNLLLKTYREKLVFNNNLYSTVFQKNKLVMHDDYVAYEHIVADKIIFCDGAAGTDNPFFKNLPYALNKGQFLLANIPNLPNNYIFKKSSLTIVPWQTEASTFIHTSAPLHTSTLNNIFWIGTSYEWNFDTTNPTKDFKDKTISQLKDFLKTPFEVLDHQASIRSATVERRPFVGMHSSIPNVGILNGMGTKGCSLAPYFAYQLAQHLCYGKLITPEADVCRFKKVLSR